VAVPPDDVAADHAALLLVVSVVRAVEGEVAQGRELGFDPVEPGGVCRGVGDLDVVRRRPCADALASLGGQVTLEQTPEGGTHWSKRELARAVGISPASVLRIWHAFGLRPWRTETFKISPDPFLIDKIRDVVGLYLAPPANAVVFAVDEKPQIQALERTAPVLPMIPGVPERRSFDYVRHGTVDLFAALNTATGKVITKLSAQHRAVDFRDFLDEIDRQTEKSLRSTSSATTSPPTRRRWCTSGCLRIPGSACTSPRPTRPGSTRSERWFAELERRCLERGVFCSLDELKTGLEEWIKTWNEQARPFKWTKTADQIIDRICRYCDRISGPGTLGRLVQQP
jgi:hypothetical protein